MNKALQGFFSSFFFFFFFLYGGKSLLSLVFLSNKNPTFFFFFFRFPCFVTLSFLLPLVPLLRGLLLCQLLLDHFGISYLFVSDRSYELHNHFAHHADEALLLCSLIALTSLNRCDAARRQAVACCFMCVLCVPPKVVHVVFRCLQEGLFRFLKAEKLPTSVSNGQRSADRT
jgi:hypothetical protein